MGADLPYLPYLPHLVIGTVSAAVLWRTPAAPAAPLVFGSVSLAIVVLPEEGTSARSLSAGIAGLMTALTFTSGVAMQPFARRRDRLLLHRGLPGLRGAVPGGRLGAVAGRTGAFGLLTGIIAVLALWTAGYAVRSGLASPRAPESESARAEGTPVPQ
jgi:hypothetical protein